MTAETAKKFAWVEQLGTEELEGMLRAEAFSAESEDPELTDLILEVIARRKKETLPDPAKAKEDFDRLYRDLNEPLYPLDAMEETPVEAGKSAPAGPRKFRRILIAAAAAVLMVAVMSVPVLGYNSVLQMIGQWTAEQFGFRVADASYDTMGNLPLREVPEEYAELQAVLNERGIDYFLFPVIPEDFSADVPILHVQQKSDNIQFTVLYKNDDNYITYMMVYTPLQSKGIYEKGEVSVEIYECNGNDHYIFENNSSTTITWHTGGLEYSIFSDLSTSELKKIIDSMYEE